MPDPTAAGMDGITQADPAAMLQAHQTYETTVNASNEAWNRIYDEANALRTTYTGESGNNFQIACGHWLDNFAIVIQNLTLMRDALNTSVGSYTRNEGDNAGQAQQLVTAASVTIPNVL
ncbi:MAG TPA: WXG100 family type VII secretion target [Mycobacteriales bacterium]|nr:WXG100 family type VII secretion target [Mycobacteriales bacterium]